MNFPSCLGSGTTGQPDLSKFCLLSLNANQKLVRNIFGWELQLYTYPSAGRPLTVLRFTVCDYNLDLSAPPGHVSDGFRVMNDWFTTAIQPILLHEQFESVPHSLHRHRAVCATCAPSARSLDCLSSKVISIKLRVASAWSNYSRRYSHRNHRIRWIIYSRHSSHISVSGEHKRQRALRQHIAIISCVSHLLLLLLSLPLSGLLKAELLPLMYLLLTPLEDTTAEVLHHNTLFFKGQWNARKATGLATAQRSCLTPLVVVPLSLSLLRRSVAARVGEHEVRVAAARIRQRGTSITGPGRGHHVGEHTSRGPSQPEQDRTTAQDSTRIHRDHLRRFVPTLRTSWAEPRAPCFPRRRRPRNEGRAPESPVRDGPQSVPHATLGLQWFVLRSGGWFIVRSEHSEPHADRSGPGRRRLTPLLGQPA
jgi:hypothetical protein